MLMEVMGWVFVVAGIVAMFSAIVLAAILIWERLRDLARHRELRRAFGDATGRLTNRPRGFKITDMTFSARLEATHREGIAAMLDDNPGATAGRTEITAVTVVTLEDDEGEISHTRVATSLYPDAPPPIHVRRYAVGIPHRKPRPSRRA